MRPNSINLVDDVFGAKNVEFFKVLFDQLVVCESDALAADFTEAALVHELANGLQIRITVSNEGLYQVEHLQHGLSNFDKNGVVKLSQAQELQDLAGLRAHAVDTSNADNDGELRLGRDVERARASCNALHSNFLFVHLPVFLGVLLSALEDRTASCRALLSFEFACLLTSLFDLL